tara:strand:+ start:7060 stop:8487 length:1428 start_codon:yes stop_codon:yes gene_type:complete
MLSFQEYLSEARITMDKYVEGDEFTLNDRKQTTVHKNLLSIGYSIGQVFKKTYKEADVTVGEGSTSVNVEDSNGKVIEILGSKSAIHGSFNTGSISGGGAMKAADWEEVITISHNMRVNNVDMDEAAKLGDISLPIKERVVVNINNGKGGSIVDAVKLPRNTMTHYGASSGTPSKLWKKTFLELGLKSPGGKTMTPKTDMYIGDSNMNISLKKSGGSQLMSGFRGESTATIVAAYNRAVKNKKINMGNELQSAFNEIQENFIKDFQDSMKIGKDVRDIRKKAKSGNILDNIESAVMSAVEKSDKLQTRLRSIFASHPIIKYYVIEEAMTGNQKFADNVPKSNYLMVFTPNGQGTHIDKIDAKIINDYVSKTTFSIGFKTAQGRGGTALRGIVSEALNEMNSEERMYLQEGIFSNMKSKLTKAVDWAKEKGIRILKEFFKKIINKVLSLLSKGFEMVQKLFGYQMTATITSNPYFV